MSLSIPLSLNQFQVVRFRFGAGRVRGGERSGGGGGGGAAGEPGRLEGGVLARDCRAEAGRETVGGGG